MNERNLYRIEKIILILVFGFSIYIPFLTGIFQEDKVSSGVEKRNLAKLPSTPESLKEFSEYPESLNTYYSDHFGLRESLTKAYFKLINNLGSESSSDDVTTGQDGWLFLGSMKSGYQGYDDPMGDAINVNLFTQEELKGFAQSIMTVKNWLKSKGVEYIYVIAPNKHTIYFDKLPKYISKQNERSATDQLVKYLNENTDIIVVDLRPALLEEKKKRQVYFKSDTHWNHYGANVAQFEIMNKIKTLFPKQISPLLLTNNQFKISSKGGGDLAAFAKIENLHEENPTPIFDGACNPTMEKPGAKEIADAKDVTDIHTMVCEGQELNAVIFRDSFFVALQPYFARNFERSTYLWKSWNNMDYDSLLKYVDQEKPDIVIDEVVERMLPYPYMPSSALLKN